MRFELIDAAKNEFPVQRLCKVLGVSPSGYFAWKERPASLRQRDDMVLLAHVRAAFAVSNRTYGSLGPNRSRSPIRRIRSMGGRSCSSRWQARPARAAAPRLPTRATSC